MKNKTLLKAVKIGLCALIILTACIIPTFAVHTGGNTLYTAPLRFDIQIDGIVADLTPSLLYTSGTSYSVVNDETATLTDGSDVSIHRGALDITSVGVYNSAVECAYKLSFDTLNSSDEFAVTITAPQGFYNFQKYSIPYIAVPNGYFATVHTEYELYKTTLGSNDDVVYREVIKNYTYRGNDSIPLLYDYVTVNSADEKLAGPVLIWNYETTITFTPSGDVTVGSAGWYKWDDYPDAVPFDISEGKAETFVLYECEVSSVYLAYVNDDFTLGYVPLSKIGFYFDQNIGEDFLAYDTSNFNTENPWLIYSYSDEAWFVPDPENILTGGDGTLTGVTPITIKYLDFRLPVEDVIKNTPTSFFPWFYGTTSYTPDNPIVTGYTSLVGSTWYIKDSVNYSAVEDFYNAYKEEFPDGTPEGDFGYYEGVKIPIDFTTDDLSSEVEFYDHVFMEFTAVSDDTLGTYFQYAFLTDFTDYNPLFRGELNTNGEMITTHYATYITLTGAPSPLAYKWLTTFCTLDSFASSTSTASTFAFTDGDTKLDFTYTLDNEAVIQAQYEDTLKAFYDVAYRVGMGNGSGEFSGDYGGWIATAVGGFMSLEIFPNFTLGGILGVAVAVGLLTMFLKFFAGG